ncbi:chemotaxis protein [Fructobacillus americanaquae]|uniref:Chemotaxis protein n=1 Tax=Fructobacillus americanaquae TaxID=2940302 RepID=A0ABY5C148_9LACO|nr:chemotaxis protein [Fructobacillus americanaquae]USS92509.1 chemotaxis protein [Fructobacillus americanaquae]
MAKFNPKQLQYYLQALQDVLTKTQERADSVSPFFVKLDSAKQESAVADMPKADFAEVKAEFDDAVAVYQENAKTLAALTVPVRFMGAHKTLAKAYQDYADATALMADALILDGQKIDDEKFAQSEADQETYLNKVQAQVAKIFGV